MELLADVIEGYHAPVIHEFTVTEPPAPVDELLAAVAAALKSDELVYLKKAINGWGVRARRVDAPFGHHL